MGHLLTDFDLEVKNLFSEYVNRRIIPLRDTLDRKEEFPGDVFREMAEQDFFRIMVPEKYGGMGKNQTQICLGIEELARGDGGIAVSYAVNSITTNGIILYGSDSQKSKYLPDIAAGSCLTAFAITEPSAGSDVTALFTRAVPDEDQYIINGTKQFITNGGVADLVMVIAQTDPGARHRGQTAFLVEKDTPGFSVGRKEEKMGLRSSVTSQLIFEDCRIPMENMLGPAGRGFYIALHLLECSRIGIGAQGVGIAQGALDESLKYCREREQFGQPISSFQAIQHMLADMATRIEAARLLVRKGAWIADSGSKSEDLIRISSMAKLFATDTAMQVTTDAVQIFGGYGYTREYPVEKMMRDAKVTQIYEGTNQIQRNLIARQLIRE